MEPKPPRRIPWPRNDSAAPCSSGLPAQTSRFASNGSDPSPFVHHHKLDIRDRAGVLALLKSLRPDAIVHTAAQPSHDRAAAIPFDDFDTNAVGTMNLLEAARQSLGAAL